MKSHECPKGFAANDVRIARSVDDLVGTLLQKPRYFKVERVRRLITNSNPVGCTTGRSAGLAPLSAADFKFL